MTTIGFRNAGRWAAAKREFCNQIQFQRFVFFDVIVGIFMM